MDFEGFSLGATLASVAGGLVLFFLGAILNHYKPFLNWLLGPPGWVKGIQRDIEDLQNKRSDSSRETNSTQDGGPETIAAVELTTVITDHFKPGEDLLRDDTEKFQIAVLIANEFAALEGANVSGYLYDRHMLERWLRSKSARLLIESYMDHGDFQMVRRAGEAKGTLQQ